MTESCDPRPAEPGRPPKLDHRAVGRARVDHVVARVRPYRPTRPVRGVVPRPDVSTRVIHRPEVTVPIFLDRSGRRARRLRRTVSWLVGVVLLLLALLWLSQVFVAAGEVPS